MKKEDIVKNNREFDNIIKKGKYKKNNEFVIYYIDNNKDNSRFGISVSKKIGNAVYRNKMKRRLRNIIDDYKKDYNNHKNYIIILRRKGIDSSYNTLKDDFFNIMTR